MWSGRRRLSRNRPTKRSRRCDGGSAPATAFRWAPPATAASECATATRVVTEITCHARGGYHHVRQPFVLIDIGGQDTKVIQIGDRGEVVDFAMNDKCAAGTGRSSR